ncbi:MAG TPA: hypothetical protein VEA40_26650 [Ramlibacter sp.]|nr:hypothetical protein [Ramlibacter sp.]
MDLAEQLRAWGQAHAAARAAERAALQRERNDTEDLRRQARALRERADRLHGEVYGALGRREKPAAG